jgi:peptide/nickel transport system substrate-binding protein
MKSGSAGGGKGRGDAGGDRTVSRQGRDGGTKHAARGRAQHQGGIARCKEIVFKAKIAPANLSANTLKRFVRTLAELPSSRCSMDLLRAIVVPSALAVALLATLAAGATFRFADQSDALSMDPHSLNEGMQLGLLGNVYEPLVGRGKKLELAPMLATSWVQTAPTVWRFNLRRNVRFHDGSLFTADDVLFSYERAKSESSDLRTHVAPFAEVRKIDDFTVDIVTTTPYPILPDAMQYWYMVSKAWCEATGAVAPVDVRKGLENPATRRANGTGPFMVQSREPGVRTVFVSFPQYWDKVEGNVTEAVFIPIKNDSTRVAALISGAVDMMQPVPLQDVERLRKTADLDVLQGPELRTIFLGMDQARNELLYSNVKGRNPFKDKRVREALYLAIDEDAIARYVMHGSATPTNLLVAPGIRGFAPELDRRPRYDPEAAKKLLAEAGYPDGFEVGMNCPNDRYVNDAAICQAIAPMLARIGIKLNLTIEPKVAYFPKLLSRNTSFYLLGWTPDAYDAQKTIFAIVMTPGAKGQGLFNIGGYSNQRVDELGDKIASELDDGKRNAMIAEVFRIVGDDFGVLPLHQQALAWGVRKNVSLVQLPDNTNRLKWVVVR